MRNVIELSVDYSRAGLAAPDMTPTLEVYLQKPSPELPAQQVKPMMIICPGGGYQMLSDREAEPIALRFLAAGYHVAILRYKVLPSVYPYAVLQLAAAVRHVRRHAAAWYVDPARVYIMGFSAGGHLACTLGTLWNDPLFHTVLDGEPDWRPDAQVLCYPVVTMGEYTHAGSRLNLIGESPDPALQHKLSLENSVSPDTVPTFLWHTMEDTVVPVENTLQYAVALRRNGVRFEAHIFECGPHGLSTCDEHTAYNPAVTYPDNTPWLQHALNFLRRRV